MTDDDDPNRMEYDMDIGVEQMKMTSEIPLRGTEVSPLLIDQQQTHLATASFCNAKWPPNKYKICAFGDGVFYS